MRYMVLCVPDWPVNCLVGDLPPSGCGAVVHGERIDVASAAARRAGVRAGMSAREATYLCPDLACLARDQDREARAFSAVIDAFDTIAAGVECLRPGAARCRAQGPARWAGGEERVVSMLVDAVEEAVGVDGGGDRIDTMSVPTVRGATDLSHRLFESGLVSQTLRIDVEDTGGGQRSRTWSGCDLSVHADVVLRVRWTLAGWMTGVEGPGARCIRSA